MSIQISSPVEMENLGACIGQCLPNGYIALKGELGAGKTTLARGLLQGLGWKHRVKSPTYTIVEPYSIGNRTVYHIDLYRIQDSDELLLLGLDQWFEQNTLCLIEWPDKVQGLLPRPDIEVEIYYKEDIRAVEFQAASKNHSNCLFKCLAHE